MELLLIYRPRRDGRLSWPSWLTDSGRLTHEVVTRQPWIRRRSGKVRQLQTDVLTTEPRRQLTTNEPDTESNRNYKTNHSTKQHAEVSIQLNIVACPTCPEKFTRGNVIAPFSVVIVTLPIHRRTSVVH